MTKLLAAIKELDIPIERLKRWYNLCSQRKPLIFSCVVFNSRIMACLIL